MYNKYKQYKAKYLKLKKFFESGSITGSYYQDNKKYNVFKTDENKYISYQPYFISSINKYITTKNLKRPQPDKILIIDSVNNFDHFTNKYGDIDFNNDHIYIKWDNVAKDYKGFYLDKTNKNLIILRHHYAYFKKYRLLSWWDYEHDNINQVMVFA